MTTTDPTVLSHMEDELRAVIDCYVPDRLTPCNSAALTMAMERASAYLLHRVYGAELAHYPTTVKVLATHMDGMAALLQGMQDGTARP